MKVEVNPQNGVEEKDKKKEFCDFRYIADPKAILIISLPLNQNVREKNNEASNEINKIENIALSH